MASIFCHQATAMAWFSNAESKWVPAPTTADAPLLTVPRLSALSVPVPVTPEPSAPNAALPTKDALGALPETSNAAAGSLLSLKSK